MSMNTIDSPSPNLIRPREGAILAEVASLHREMESDVDEFLFSPDLVWKIASARIDQLVYKYYDIDAFENCLVEDTVKVWIPERHADTGEPRYTQPSGEQSYTSGRIPLAAAANS